jgi:hypothetical protein
MNGTLFARLLAIGLMVFPARAWAQAEQRPPRQFPEFVGTWTLDGSAGRGHIAGLPVARTIAITTTPTEISLVKDSASEIYKLDGSETTMRDAGPGPPGSLATLEDANNNRQTLVYRRNPQALGR